MSSGLSSLSDSNDINAVVSAYRKLIKLRDEATTPEDAQDYSDMIKDVENSLTNTSLDLMDIQDKLRALPNPTKEEKQILDEINNSLKYTRSILTPDELFGEAWGKLTSAQQEYLATSVRNGTLTKEQIENYDSLNDILGINGFSFEKLVAYIVDTTNATNNGINANNNYKKSAEELAEAYKKFQEALSATTTKLEDYNAS
jgi:hypothetical protein